MSYIEKVETLAAKKKERKSPKAKPAKTPKSLAFDYFEAEEKLKKLKGKDSWNHKKIQKEVNKLRKELDKNEIGHQKLAKYYDTFLKGKVK